MSKGERYIEQSAEMQAANEPSAAYGNIDVLKVRLVRRIMNMDTLTEVKSVLDFVEKQDELENAISGEELLSRLRPRMQALFKS